MATYIEREALMDEFRKYMAARHDREKCVSEENCKTCDKGCLWRKVVGKAPAADIAPVVHGRWLPCGFGKEIMCSVCRGELDDVWEYRHCPNCGARMDGE